MDIPTAISSRTHLLSNTEWNRLGPFQMSQCAESGSCLATSELPTCIDAEMSFDNPSSGQPATNGMYVSQHNTGAPH